jgi:hypothetical protein
VDCAARGVGMSTDIWPVVVGVVIVAVIVIVVFGLL